MQLLTGKNTEDDAMFAKRGFTCLSCDKQIPTLNGTVADF